MTFATGPMQVTSVTHAHLIYAMLAEDLGNQASYRVLDAGCGSGAFLAAAHANLNARSNSVWELHGFDVSDARVQRTTFFNDALTRLRTEHPNVDWGERLALTKSGTQWPYPDAHFDCIVSNQVLEHVSDLDRFLAETARVLRPGGVSLNLFPVKSQALETHVGAPLAHRIASDDVRRAYLTTLARLGLSKLGPMRIAVDQSPEHFGETRAEYIASQTFYRSFREIADTAHRHGLTISYRWTPQFYGTKLCYLYGRDPQRLYEPRRNSALLDAVTFPFLSRISSVSLRFQSSQIYDPDEEFAGHLD